MKIAIVDEDPARAALMVDGLARQGGTETFVLSDRDGLLARIAAIAPDVVLMSLGNPSRDMLEEYFTISRALDRPIAMFVDDADGDSIAASIDAGVSAYIIDGLSGRRIRPIIDLAIRRFSAYARLQAELTEARGQLAERRLIDDAKRLLMQRNALTEPQAYALLRRHAMQGNRRIADVAEALLTAEQLMRDAATDGPTTDGPAADGAAIGGKGDGDG